MAYTYVKIASTTVGVAGTSSIDFTSIPNTYTDLSIKFSLRYGDYPSWNYAYIQLNSTAGTTRALYGSGSAAGSFSVAGSLRIDNVAGTGQTASTFSNGEVYIPNYTSSNAKSISLDHAAENNATAAYAEIVAGLFSTVTSAVTSVSLQAEPGYKFAQYSTATLYGIKNS